MHTIRLFSKKKTARLKHELGVTVIGLSFTEVPGVGLLNKKLILKE